MNDYEKILDLTFEIEGLLTLAQQRGEETPSAIVALIKEKASRLEELTSSLSVSETASDDQAIALSAEEEQVEDADPFDVDDEEIAPVATVAETTPEPEPVAEPVVEAVEQTEEYEEVEEAAAEPAEIPVADEEMTVVTEEAEEQPREDAPADVAPAEEAPFTLADRLSIDQAKAKDIKRAFTLNDRFRFKRELFGNSESNFADALNVIAAMSTYEEAEEYFYNDLCWSADNDEVKDFMTIVHNHFS